MAWQAVSVHLVLIVLLREAVEKQQLLIALVACRRVVEGSWHAVWQARLVQDRQDSGFIKAVQACLRPC